MTDLKTVFLTDISKAGTKLKKKSGEISHQSLLQFPFLIRLSHFCKVKNIRVFGQFLSKIAVGSRKQA